jgi:hypothetical protein
MKNLLAKNLFWNILIALEVFVTFTLTTFLVFVFILINSVTDALSDFTVAAISPFS